MTDEELDRWLARAAREWRLPEAPPFDDMWETIASRAFVSASRRTPGWSVVGIAAAAALVIGVAGGRTWTLRHAARPAPIVAAAPVPAQNILPVATTVQTDNPAHHAVGELLGRTAVLLASLPRDSSAHPLDPQITREGAHLLTTTRLLLDSPVAEQDPRLRNLLEDLELVLAQVARLEARPHHDDIQFIQSAVADHDLVPRLRLAAEDLSTNGF